MLIRRILVIFCPVLIGFLLVIFNYKIFWVYYILPLVLLLLIASLKLLVKKSFTQSSFWYFVLTPLYNLLVMVLIMLLLENAFWRILLIAIHVLLLILYFENVYLYFYVPVKYQAYSLENIINNHNLISIFLLTTGLFALLILVGIPAWQLSIVLIISLLVLTKQTFWFNKLESQASWIYLMVLAIIMFELFWTLTFLSTSFYVNGLFLAMIYYFMLTVFKDKLTNKQINKKFLRKNLIFIAILLLIVIATARW